MSLPDWLKPPIIDVAESKKEQIPWWVQENSAVDNIQKRMRYKKHLSDQQNAPDLFPLSNTNVPPKNTHEEYLQFLEPYKQMLQSDKTEFLDGHTSPGHKIHLNVAPENVQYVSQYLKHNQYAHKYLSGGEAEDGTIFTIYLGSLSKANQWCGILANELKQLLQRPLRNDEIEYAPNISGRFVGNRKEFTQYPKAGTRGLSSLATLVKNDIWIKRTPEELLKHSMDVFNKSYDQLADQYATYFYG